jgi:hypothetical protein
MSDPKTTDWAAWLRDNAPPGPLGRNMVSAANELDRLRTALLQIAGPIKPDRHGTALHERMRQIAREALS